MKKFRLSTQAARDMREILAYIVVDSIRAARKVRLSLFDACQMLSKNPALGHPRKDLTDERLLFWPVGSYLILYDPMTTPITVVRVVHAARDVAKLI